MLTDEQIAELERLDREATPGPWDVEGVSFDEDGNEVLMPYGLCGPSGATIWSSGSGEYTHPDMSTARFVASARTAVPALVAEVRRLRVEVDHWKGAAREHAKNLADAVGALDLARREGAEEMRERVAAWFDCGADGECRCWDDRVLAERIRALPLPGDE